MNLYDLFEGASAAGYDNIKQILTAVQNKTPATIHLTNGEDVTVDYTEARWLAGKFRALQKVGRQEEFMMDVEDPVRLDGHMSQLRKLIDKQKNFQGSVVGQRDIPGETDKPYQKTLGEQYEGSPRAIGTAHVGLLDKKKETDEAVTVSFGPNGPAWEIPGKSNKKWFLNVWQSYKRVGREDQFLELMGTPDGFRKLLMRLARENAKVVRDRMLGKNLQKPTESDSVDSQKKNPVTEESNSALDDKAVNARTQRMLRQLRIQNPQAQSDLEALAYSVIDGQRKDREDIEKLEKETDNIEQNVKGDLQKRIDTMNTQRGRIVDRLNQVQNTNKEQDEFLNQLLQLDKQQQQALDALKKTTQKKGDKSVAQPKAAEPGASLDLPGAPAAEPDAPAPQPKKQASRAPKPQGTMSAVDTDDEMARAQMSLPIGKPIRQKPALTVVPKSPAPVNIGGPEEQPTGQDDMFSAEPMKVSQVAEDADSDNKLAKLLTRFINQEEGADRAVASDAIEYIKKMGHMEQFATSLDYFTSDLDEGRAGFNPIRDKEDYLDKRDHLFKQMNLPMMSQQDKEVIKQRILDLDSEATKLKLINQNLSQEESYNHMYNRGISEAQKKFPKASQEVIHEWAAKWAKAHGVQLNENQFDHVANNRLKRILVSGAKNLADVAWAMEFTQDALYDDYDNEMIPSSVFDARSSAFRQAEVAFQDEDGEVNPEADLDATLAHLKQFWSV